MSSDTDIRAGSPAASSEAHRVLDRARSRHYEDTGGALADALHCREVARTLDDASLRSRAQALQAAVMLQRGDLRGAIALVAEADEDAARGDDRRAHAEVAAVKAHLSFFAGSYAESLMQAERAISLADREGDPPLRIFARRSACLVFGNLGVRDWPERLAELLALTVAADDRWEEAISRNDLAHLRMEQGDLPAAELEMERAFAVAAACAPDNRFALGVLSCTRADIRLRAGRPDAALADTRSALDALTASGDPNPYVVAMTVVIQVQALVALGRPAEAERCGQRAVTGLGELVPRARSLILATVATALREAGRTEEAYDALALSAEVERRAFEELSELQRGLERATLETHAARGQADALAAKNRELEDVVRELGRTQAALERRTAQLEDLQVQLREQADRDWLTGLHNRRYLAREVGRHAAEPTAGPFSLAVLDLDHFKAINDRFGHDAGDRVLTRAAALLLAEMREQDAVVRTGGEEFMLLMPDTASNAAIAACERLRRRIADEPWDQVAEGVVLTASVGVATAGDVTDLDGLARLADRRLYEAKRSGRDRVVAVGGEDGRPVDAGAPRGVARLTPGARAGRPAPPPGPPPSPGP
jgi:diguanylate cyclase (GGDEF)-like protein